MPWGVPGLFFFALMGTASLTAVRLSDTGSSTVLTCAGNFTLRERACYSYPGQAVRRSFYHAERHCSRLQASLASLLSYDEESFVVQLVDKETPFWIGLTDQANDKNASVARFRWTDGADLTAHARWRAGELIGAGHLHCVQVDREGWALARGGCASTKLPFVCKKQACPDGLEWSGNGCDTITSPSSSPLSLFSHPLPLLLLCVVVVSLAGVMYHRIVGHLTASQRNRLHNISSYHSHKEMHHNVQDIYPT